MELIDKAALLEKSYYRGRPATVDHPWPDGAEVVDVEDIEDMPTIDAALVVHGQWEQGDYYDYGDVCSICDWDSGIDDCTWPYCPNCGAKMDLEVR
jgi:hypothetical protein